MKEAQQKIKTFPIQQIAKKTYSNAIFNQNLLNLTQRNTHQISIPDTLVPKSALASVPEYVPKSALAGYDENTKKLKKLKQLKKPKSIPNKLESLARLESLAHSIKCCGKNIKIYVNPDNVKEFKAFPLYCYSNFDDKCASYRLSKKNYRIRNSKYVPMKYPKFSFNLMYPKLTPFQQINCNNLKSSSEKKEYILKIRESFNKNICKGKHLSIGIKEKIPVSEFNENPVKYLDSLYSKINKFISIIRNPPYELLAKYIKENPENNKESSKLIKSDFSCEFRGIKGSPDYMLYTDADGVDSLWIHTHIFLFIDNHNLPSEKNSEILPFWRFVLKEVSGDTLGLSVFGGVRNGHNVIKYLNKRCVGIFGHNPNYSSNDDIDFDSWNLNLTKREGRFYYKDFLSLESFMTIKGKYKQRYLGERYAKELITKERKNKKGKISKIKCWVSVKNIPVGLINNKRTSKSNVIMTKSGFPMLFLRYIPEKEFMDWVIMVNHLPDNSKIADLNPICPIPISEISCGGGVCE